MASEFKLPDLGEGIHEAQIINVLIQEGDQIEEDQPIFEVETDKAAVEIPSPQAGRVAKIHVENGQTIKVGETLVSFGDNGSGEGREKKPGDSKKPSQATKETESKKEDSKKSTGKKSQEPRKAEEEKEKVDASEEPSIASTSPAKSGRPAKVAAAPVVRKLARERGIDLASIEGTGPGGRVTREDVEKAVDGKGKPEKHEAGKQAVTPQQPMDASLPDFTKWGSVRRESISQIRKTIANQMVRSEAINVHVMHNDLADIQMLEQLRKDHNARKRDDEPKLTLLPFVIKAIVSAMRRFPVFNSSFDHGTNEIIYKEYHHFGIAVDTPRGLVVPVIRDVDRKSIRELAADLTELGEKARKASFTIEELRGGTFTITNIGSLGGRVSTPIINYPEVAILGLGKAEMMPVVRDQEVVARYMMPLNLSFDHRVIDGADAARFTTEVLRYLEIPGRLLLED